MRRSFRLILGLAVALAALMPSAGSPVAAQSVDAGYFRFATAMWRPARSPLVYIADAFYLVDPQNGEIGTAYVFVTRGRCQDQRNEHFVIVSCVAKGHGGEVDASQFTMEQDLSAAHAEVRVGRTLHRVDWTGLGEDPQWTPFGGVGQVESILGVSQARDAVAAGRLYGVKLAARPDPFRFTMMAQEAVVEYSLTEMLAERGITLRPGGRVEIRRTYRFAVPGRTA